VHVLSLDASVAGRKPGVGLPPRPAGAAVVLDFTIDRRSGQIGWLSEQLRERRRTLSASACNTL